MQVTVEKVLLVVIVVLELLVLWMAVELLRRECHAQVMTTETARYGGVYR